MLSRSHDEDMTAQEVVSAFEEVLANLPSDDAIRNLSPIDVAHYYEALAQDTRDGAREFAEFVSVTKAEEENAYQSKLRQAEEYEEWINRLARVSSVGDDAEICNDLKQTREHALRERKRQEIQSLKEELAVIDRSLMSVRRPVGYPIPSEEDHDFIDDYSYRHERSKFILLLAKIYEKQVEEEAGYLIGPSRMYEQNAATLREWVSNLDSDDSDKRDRGREHIREFLRDRRDHLSAGRRNHIREELGYIPEYNLAERYK